MRVPTEDLREEAETPVGFASNCGGPSSIMLRANLPRVGWFEVPSPLHYRPLPPARVFESYAGPSGEQNEWTRVIRRRSLAPAKGSRVTRTISSLCFTYASLWCRLSPAQNRVYISSEAGSDAEIGDHSGLIPGPIARSLKLKGRLGCSRGWEREAWQRWPTRPLAQKPERSMGARNCWRITNDIRSIRWERLAVKCWVMILDSLVFPLRCCFVMQGRTVRHKPQSLG